MEDPRAATGLTATPRQLLLIGVSGVLLAGVLIVQFGGASVSPEDAVSAGATPPAAAASATSGPIKAPAPASLLASALDQRGQVASIGSRMVRVGDVIEGYRVRSIDAGGVLLVPSGHQDARQGSPR